MLLYRLGPDGAHVVVSEGRARFLYSDPFETLPTAWEYGRDVDPELMGVLPPVVPRKIVGVGRNYVEHAAELGNEVPEEPLLFLKAPTSVVGPRAPILLPPESERVDFEGEIAVVVRERLARVDEEEAARGLLGVTAACDVTARDLQRRDATFARAKSFDTFCPLGPGILVGADPAALEVVTRVNGEERQRGRASRMAFSIPFLVSYISRMMTLEPGDVVLTGTPSGVGPLAAGDRLEVEVPGVGVLGNPVARLREAAR
jgi:2-keto-4-pentenoate hydratase/2-oxohepta-3-ene-1,7-dioic acid hydratase in catechol pathway